MINIKEAEQLVKSLNVKYCLENLRQGGFKFSMKLTDKELFLITVAEFSDKPEWDCVYSLFSDRELILSNGGLFTDVIENLKKYLASNNKNHSL